MLSRFVSPRQLARAAGVSESSVKRWCDQGLIPTVKTAGGHRRLTVEAATDFLRRLGSPETRPELLMLPVRQGQGARTIRETTEDFFTALVAGDDATCSRILLDRHVGGDRMSQLCDNVIAPALHRVGAAWEHHDVEVYQERRACGICARLLDTLGIAITSADASGPLAIGGSPECDPYAIPNAMVELVLKQTGWRTQSLGSQLPFATLVQAVRDARPQLFWLSVSTIDDERRFLDGYRTFYDQVHAELAVVVGGRALTEPVRRQMEYAAYCDNLLHLEAFAKTLRRTLVKDERQVRRQPSTARKRASPNRKPS